MNYCEKLYIEAAYTTFDEINASVCVILMHIYSFPL